MSRNTRLDQPPCPHRIIDDMGGAFAMGAFGGSLFYIIKGYRNSPPGQKLRGAIQMAKLRTPTLGGSFAVWGGCFSMYDCTFLHLRGKEDPWNAIGSGAATGATLAFRSGWRSMARQGLFGGIFLAVIEGLGIVVSKWMTSANQATMNDVGSLTSYGSSSARDSAPLPAPENILLVNHRPGELLDSPELSLSTDTGIGSSEFLDDSQEFVFEDDFGEKFQDGYE